MVVDIVARHLNIEAKPEFGSFDLQSAPAGTVICAPDNWKPSDPAMEYWARKVEQIVKAHGPLVFEGKGHGPDDFRYYAKLDHCGPCMDVEIEANLADNPHPCPAEHDDWRYSCDNITVYDQMQYYEFLPPEARPK